MGDRRETEVVLKSANLVGLGLRTCNKKPDIQTPQNIFFTTEAQSARRGLIYCFAGRRPAISGMTDLVLFIIGRPSAKQYHVPLRGNGRKIFYIR